MSERKYESRAEYEAHTTRPLSTGERFFLCLLLGWVASIWFLLLILLKS